MSDNLVGTKLGNYRLERMLGRGRMGVVYLAHDEALLRPTAVKILSWSLPESQGQNPEAWFIAEARNVARVNHPHVVRIYSVARHGAYCYIAMEYVEGATADAWIERHGPFSVERATELLIQMAGALQAAHDANVVHRDIKPENVLVGSDGNGKLSDFGMATHIAKPRAVDAVRAGTPYYTAPEIWRGDTASASSDIYALGATYYYLLTGRPPFVAKELQELAVAHMNSEIPEIRTANGIGPSACQEILQRCMAKLPNQRFPTAQALGWEARALLRRLSIPPSTTPPPSASGTPNRENGASLALPKLGVFAAPEIRSVPAPAADWRSFYGFASEPFTRREPGCMPYQGEPFGSLLLQLEEHLRAAECSTALLVGPSGSGRTSVAQALLAQQAPLELCAYISCDEIGPTQTLAKKALRAFGMPGSAEHGVVRDIDALVECCLAERGSRAAPLLVVDDCDRGSGTVDELASLALAAQLTNSFRLLLLVGPSFEGRLAHCDSLVNKVTVRTISISALRGTEVGGYIAIWLRSALVPEASPIVFTPDAILIITLRSQGIASKVNQIVTNMLIGGAAQERRILDSWDAWSASEGPSSGVPLPRPRDWPSPEALQVLNQCRREAGMQSRR
jgi:serine/threonine protein kinase